MCPLRANWTLGQRVHESARCTRSQQGESSSRARRAKTEPCGVRIPINASTRSPLGHVFAKDPSRFVASRRTPTKGLWNVVDTAAQSGLIGEPALQRLQRSLRQRGLQGVWTGKSAQARGVGGEAKVCGVIEIPLGLGGVSGILECTVVQEDVPLLLPIRLLRELQAVVDLNSNQLVLQHHLQIPMNTLPSGHASVDVMDFGPNGWTLPSAARSAGRKEQDFKVYVACYPVMSGPSTSFNLQFGPLRNSNPKCHGAAESTSTTTSSGGDGRHGHGRTSTSTTTLAYHWQEGPGVHWPVRGKPNGRGSRVRLAHGWIRRWLIAAMLCGGTACPTTSHGELKRPTLGDIHSAHLQARAVCAGDQIGGNLPRLEEVRQACHGSLREVLTPHQLPGGRWECGSERSVVSKLPCTMEGGISGTQDGSQDRAMDESTSDVIDGTTWRISPNRPG